MVDPARAAEGMCRPEIETLLREGEQIFVAALEPTRIVFEPREALMRLGEAHEYVYVIKQGWLARVRTIDDGRRVSPPSSTPPARRS